MKFLCVSYTTVQTMKLLYATSHYLLLFFAKIMHICIKPLSTCCLLRRTKLLSHLKPDTHDGTFICNFCMQLLCVSYITVQPMKLLYATSHYLLLFPTKIIHICIKPLSLWCLLRRTKLSDPVKCIPLQVLLVVPFTETLLIAIALLTFLFDKNHCRPDIVPSLKDPFLIA